MIRHQSSHWPNDADGHAKCNRTACALAQRMSETDSLPRRQEVQMQSRSTYYKKEGNCLHKKKGNIDQNDEHDLDQNTQRVMFRKEERNAVLIKM